MSAKKDFTNNSNQLKFGAMLSYFSMGIGYIVSIGFTPIMLRLLGQSEYGLYNLVASVVAYLGVLNFGYGSAYMRYYTRYKILEDKEKISILNGMFLIIFIILGIIAVICGIILTLNSEIIFGSRMTISELSKAKILMTVLVFNIAISFPCIIFTSHITANEQFVFQKILQMFKTILNPFVILPILILGYGSVGMVIVTSLLNLVIELCNIFYAFKKLKIEFSFKKFDFSLMKDMTIFSSFIFLNMLIDQVNWNLDKFIVGRYRGTISVAIYGLAAQLSTYYLSISGVISSVFIPRINKIVFNNIDNNELTILFTKIGRIQFIVLSLISSGFIFFGKPFINLWAGKEYNNSYIIVLILILPATLPLIQNITIEIQRAKNLHKFRSWIYFLIAILNLSISLPLTKLYGGVGAASGTALALIIGNGIIMNLYNHFKVGLDMKYFWCQISKFLPSLILPIIYGILVNYFINIRSLFLLILLGGLYILVFSVSMWYLGMNQNEKDLFQFTLIKAKREQL